MSGRLRSPGNRGNLRQEIGSRPHWHFVPRSSPIPDDAAISLRQSVIATAGRKKDGHGTGNSRGTQIHLPADVSQMVPKLQELNRQRHKLILTHKSVI